MIIIENILTDTYLYKKNQTFAKNSTNLENYKLSLKRNITKEIITEIIVSLGFQVNRNLKFKIREENTASASIYYNKNGEAVVKDFGGEHYDAIELVKQQLQCTFIEALNYIAPFVNKEPYNNKSNYIPKPLPINREIQIDKDILLYAKSLKKKHKRESTDKLILNGLQELYPHLESLQYLNNISQYFAYSSYHNSLTIEFPKCSLIRRDKHGNKWRAIKGNKRDYIVNNISPSDDYVYIYSGMAEMVAMEKMQLSYIGLQADKINDISQNIINKVGNKTLVVLEENDESSKKLSQELLKIFDNVKILKLINLSDNKVLKGYDLRDLVNECKSFDIAKKLLVSNTNSLPLISNKKKKKTITIPYEGRYISNQKELDISSLQQGVVIAKTGSGKTHSFNNVANTLILVPRVLQVDVKAGEGTEYLLNKILTSGAKITYEKFFGHFNSSSEFKEYITNKQIRVVVDEAHLLLAKQSKEYETIYNLDAIFLSGTIESFFRDDLQHYKFKPETPSTMYYTNNSTPDLENSLLFTDRAEVLKTNYKDCCIVGSSHNFKNVDIHTHKKGTVYTTSALREGISINTQAFDNCIVDAKTTTQWSVKDTIQALQRIRDDKVTRIVSKPIINKKTNYTIEHFMKIAEEYSSSQSINAVMGEFYSDFIKTVFKLNSYLKPTKYSVSCYLAKLTKNQYDEDLYSFKEYTQPFKEFKLNTYKGKVKISSSSETGTITLKNGKSFTFSMKVAQNKRTMNLWKELKDNGVVDRFTKFTERRSLQSIYKTSNIAKELKSQHNKINAYQIKTKRKKKKTFDTFQLLKIMRSACKLKITLEDGTEIQRVTGKNINNIYIEVIADCPIELVSQNIENTRDTNISLNALNNNSEHSSSKPAKLDTKTESIIERNFRLFRQKKDEIFHLKDFHSSYLIKSNPHIKKIDFIQII